ncbi:MAG: hypothetical protein ACRBBN_09685 [Methyloligellaceae bacterium]
MKLNTPTLPVFLLSVILVAAVIAIRYFSLNFPLASTIVSFGLFEILLLAYGLLFLGNIMRRF